MPTYTLTETENFDAKPISSSMFGTNFVITNEIEFTPNSSSVALLEGLHVDNLRYPGGSVTEQQFDMTQPNLATAADGSGKAIVPMNQFFEVAGQIGADVTLVIPTRVAFEDSAGQALASGPNAQSSGTYGSRTLLETDYLSDVESYINDALALATANDVVITTFEIGNEFWGSAQMTASEYGFLAGTVASSLDPLFPDQDIIVQVVHSANELSPRYDTAVFLEPIAGGDYAIRSQKFLDDNHSGVMPNGWLERQIDGNGTWRDQVIDIANEISSVPGAVNAFDGIVDHAYFKEGFAGVDTEKDVVLIRQMNQFSSTINRSDLTHTLTEWSPGRPSTDQGNDGGTLADLNAAGLQHASIVTEIFFELSSHGVDSANFWPLTFSNQSTKGRVLIDTQQMDYTFGGEVFRFLSETVIGTKSVLDFEVADEIDVHGFSDDARFVAFVSERSGLDQDQNAGQGVTLDFSNFVSTGTYFLAMTHLGEDGTTGTSIGANPVLTFSDGITITSNSVTFSLDAWGLQRIEFTEITGGADSIEGRGGNDSVNGLGGNDTISGAAGDDTLLGDAGDDLLIGGAGADSLDGGIGTDEISFFDANSGLIADLQFSSGNTGDADGDSYQGIENMSGSSHADDLRGNTGNNALSGLKGNDVLHGRGGNDTLLGGDGNDVLLGNVGADQLIGGAGIDRAAYWSSASAVLADLQFAAANTGEAFGDSYTDIEDIQGSAFNDDLRGDEGSNTIWGIAGNDTLDGRDGADTLLGGDGDDSLLGDGGDDSLDGGSGNDALHGGLGEDDLAGGDGNDTLDGGKWNDTVSGGDGNDSVFGDNGSDELNGGTGADTLDGGGGQDVLNGDDGNDVLSGGVGFDTLNGGLGEDTLSGDGGSDELNGGKWNDTLNGGAGNDTLNGGNANDVLNGGVGNDVLAGGGGADVFVFAIGGGIDTISDFQDETDVINLSGFGLASASDAMLLATAVSADVVFDFGNGDVLIVETASLSEVQNDLIV